MPLRRRRQDAPDPPEPVTQPPRDSGPPPEEIVRVYLRGQNLEQMRHIDEAVELYEQAVAARFDAAGPYDRLIAIYRGREQHADVRRIAEAALSNVRTFDEKKGWYDSMREGAEEAHRTRPDPRGAEF